MVIDVEVWTEAVQVSKSFAMQLQTTELKAGHAAAPRSSRHRKLFWRRKTETTHRSGAVRAPATAGEGTMLMVQRRRLRDSHRSTQHSVPLDHQPPHHGVRNLLLPQEHGAAEERRDDCPCVHCSCW